MWRTLIHCLGRDASIPKRVARVLNEFRADGRQSKLVTIIQPGNVRYRARILKVTESLRKRGYAVILFAKLPVGSGFRDVQLTNLSDCPVFAFPDAHDFLIAARTKVPSLNWPFMVQYLTASMWHYINWLKPEVIHTFNVGAIGIGHDFRDRLIRAGTTTTWLHDFTEYIAGHRFGDDGRESEDDAEWRRVVVEHEARHATSPDRSFTVSNAASDALMLDYVMERPPVVLLNTPRLGAFRPDSRASIRRRLNLNPEVPLFVYSGGVTPLRGVRTAVLALAELPEAHLALLTNASTPYLNSLMAEARASGSGARLHVLPYVEPETIPAFLRDATAGIHPMVHYGNAEVALPNKLFDYLHARIPVVVSDVREMAKFVEGNGLGEVFRPEDPIALAVALRRVTAKRAEVSQRIATDAALLRRYSWEEQETKLLSVYDEVDERARY